MYDDIKYLIDSSNYIYICGNGGCCSMADHLACDLLKNAGIKAISLCSNNALITAIGNDDGYENIFTKQLEVLFDHSDTLIVLSGSGNSRNVIHAANYVNTINTSIIAITNETGYLRNISRYSIPVSGKDMQQWENRINEICHELYQQLIKE